MAASTSDANRTANRHANASDVLVGGSMGALLGVLLGLSATPVVATIIAAVLSLLGAALEASGRLSASESSKRRVTAFALAALLFGLLALWARTNQLLMPSLEQQRKQLQQIGYLRGSPEEREMLLYLRYGIQPAGKSVPDHNASQGVFFSGGTAMMCDEIEQADNRDDLLLIVKQAGEGAAELHQKLSALPQSWPESQVAAVKAAICP